MYIIYCRIIDDDFIVVEIEFIVNISLSATRRLFYSKNIFFLAINNSPKVTNILPIFISKIATFSFHASAIFLASHSYSLPSSANVSCDSHFGEAL